MCGCLVMSICPFSKALTPILPKAQVLTLYLGSWEETLPSLSLHMASSGQRNAAPAVQVLNLFSYMKTSTEPVTASRV